MFSSITNLKAIASIFSIISITQAHMIMRTPTPYGLGRELNNSPLDANGKDFPCKGIFEMVDPVKDINHLVPGESNTLSFTGSAVHGGGSCQVSLTSDLAPTRDSKWMVIKSIEGGCPANVDGNLPADPEGTGASTFQYVVPEGFPEGQYTIAWTWFNRIGNREMYMNCGRASIANSKKRYAPAKPKVEHRAADYPDIFKANLTPFTCTVPDNKNVHFPNGGPDVQVLGATVDAQCAGGSGGSSGGSSPQPAVSSVASAPSSAAVKPSASRVASSPAAAAPTGGYGGSSPQPTGGFAHGSSPASQPTAVPGNFAPSGSATSPAETNAPTDSPVQPTATVVPIPAAPAPSPSSGSSTSSPAPSTGSTTQGTKCSEEGAWACSSDGTSFQRCASGMWSASMNVAAGTSCTPGQSMNLSMKVVSGIHKKRAVGSRLHGAALHRRRSNHLSE